MPTLRVKLLKIGAVVLRNTRRMRVLLLWVGRIRRYFIMSPGLGSFQPSALFQITF
ncbi:MAG: hypothetical protein Tsb0026_21050 [Sulfuricaulis sp.]